MIPSDPAPTYTIPISLSRYVLDATHIDGLASEYYGEVLEAATVESGNGSSDGATDLTISFTSKAYRDLFVGILHSPTFLKGDLIE